MATGIVPRDAAATEANRPQLEYQMEAVQPSEDDLQPHPQEAPASSKDTTTTNDPSQIDPSDLPTFISQPRFHNKFTFHSTIAAKDLTASYSIAGSQSPSAPTFLYVGGVFGGRFHALFVDYLCTQKGVRGIFPDRPGLGLFTPVPIEQRTEVFLEAIPRILEHAGVDHEVVLMALSGGVPYALNLLWRRPDLLKQDVYFFSPWVHPTKSGVRWHMWVSMLPAYMTRSVGKLAFMMLKRLIARVPRESGKKFIQKVDNLEEKLQETCGAGIDEIDRRRQGYANALFAEDISGSAEDYLLGVKDPKGTWGVAHDYQEYAKMLAERCRGESTRLRLHAIFAANDAFIGNQGIQYFNDVFGDKEGLDYESEIVEGSNHEGVAFPEVGIIGRLMDEYLEAVSIDAEKK